MRFIPCDEIGDVMLIEPRVFSDARGFFAETYHAARYRHAGLQATFVQDNHSRSVRHTLRGLHAQRRHAQAKLVRAIVGEIFDVAVDLRRGSPTFGRWVGQPLSATNHRQLFIPRGFAHGFCVLSDVAEVEYKCDDYYDPDSEFSIRWDDPQIAIDWPVREPILSDKDRNAPTLSAVAPTLPDSDSYHYR